MKLTPVTFTIAVLWLTSFAFGFESREQCLTVVTPRQIALEKERIKSGWIYETPVRDRELYLIPLTIHILRNSTGWGGFDPANIDLAMDDLNFCFLITGMTFFIRGDIDYMDDDYFFYNLDSPVECDSLRRTNVVPNTVNIYIAPLQSGFPGAGLSSMTGDPVQGVIVREDATGTPNDPSTLAHEVGHYFDLYHTHTQYFGAECPERVGCDTLGDLLCDTPADPNLNPTGFFNVSEYPECAYDNYITVPDLPHCDQMTPYDPATDNVLSYSRPLCRTEITPGQAERAVHVLVTAENRRNLYHAVGVSSHSYYGLALLTLWLLFIGGWSLRIRVTVSATGK